MAASKRPKAPRKRRGPKHPGVVLIKPNSARRSWWMARYKDPDSGKTRHETLPEDHTTLEQREQWCVEKAKKLAKRRMELDGGAPRATGTKLSVAADRYFKAHPQLRPRTRSAYRAVADKLVSWGGRVGLRSADDLNRARLMSFRETLVREPKRAAKKGGKRGSFVATDQLRSPERVNSELRKARTVLGYLRRLDLLPKLTNDDLQDALKRLPVASERIEYLRPHELQELLQAALRHDAKMFAETRDEHAGDGRKRIGTTPRYDPIAPFVAFVLLSGCRFAEALALDWAQVDLDALDHEGRKVGEIHLRGAATKTHKARTIGLEVSPALRQLLATMHLASGAKGSVFGLSRGTAEAAAKRLRAEYGAPESFTWQALRRTCGTFLTCSPGIFGAASAYRSAKQLGHSVQVAERHYVGVVRGIPPDAHCLEAAMQIEDVMAKLLAAAPGRVLGEIADLKKSQVGGRVTP